MQILAHRGYWKVAEEKNSKVALARALEFCFGIETDIRDCCGEAVISHDMPEDLESCMTLEQFLQLYLDSKANTVIALNVKADGLQEKVAEAFKRLNVDSSRFFFFDMAVPDAMGYWKQGLRCYTRYSEIERAPSFLEKAKGVWVDAFESEAGQIDAALEFLERGYEIALVSPELHRREHKNIWAEWKNRLDKKLSSDRVFLCTDYPEKAEAFFHE